MANKKGQTGATLVELLIALVLIIAIGYGIYAAVNYFGATAGEYAPSELQTIAGACQVTLNFGETGIIDYCTKPREITYGSETRYLICNYTEIESRLTNVAFKCTTQDMVSACNQINASLGSTKFASGSNVLLNNVPCSTILTAAAAPTTPAP